MIVREVTFFLFLEYFFPALWNMRLKAGGGIVGTTMTLTICELTVPSFCALGTAFLRSADGKKQL
eukprot:4511272-Amphidinium_carterae.1